MLAWVFLYAASRQVFNPGFSVAGLVSRTTTSNPIFGWIADPAVAPIFSFLVAYGHLLVGLSLLLGLFFRLGGLVGAFLMMVYWLAHMDFPYIEGPQNLLIDYHVIYATVLVFLVLNRAGHSYGLDAMAGKFGFVANRPWLQSLVT